MSEFKGTPGQWELIGNAVMPSPDSKVPDTMLGIAQIYTFDGERSSEKTQANGRLIAAAPKLLVVCQKLLNERLSELAHHADYREDDAEMASAEDDDLVREARATIAKALGETP